MSSSNPDLNSVERANQVPQTWDEHPENPYNWPEKKKWIIFSAAQFAVVLGGLNATGIATPSADIADAFHVDYSTFPNDYWPICAWTVGAGFGPLVGIPLLENFGVRIGYLADYALLVLFIIPQAVARNFATMLVSRAISGALCGVVLLVSEVILSDCWCTDEGKNLALTMFAFAYMTGITLGPVFGAMAQNLGWRWVSYMELILFGAHLPVLFLVIKETRGPIIRAQLAKSGKLSNDLTQMIDHKSPKSEETKATLSPIRSKSLQRTTSTQTRSSSLPVPEEEPISFYNVIIRPAQLLVTEPVVTAFTLWDAFAFGLVFLSTQSIPLVFQPLHGFSAYQCGLVQLSLFIGEVIGVFLMLPQNKYYLASASRNREHPGLPIPEARLPWSIPASLFGMAGGLFWYAWTGAPGYHWSLPAAGLLLVGIGIQIIITTTAFYITDAYGFFAGSALTALAFGECMVSAFVPLAARRMYTHLGMRWAGSVLGFIAIALTAAPVVLWPAGRWIRRKSPFMRAACEAKG